MTTISAIMNLIVKGLAVPAIFAVMSLFSFDNALFTHKTKPANTETEVAASTASPVEANSNDNVIYVYNETREVVISAKRQATEAPVPATPPATSVLDRIENAPNYWPAQIDSLIHLEKSNPIEQMETDRYYWIHYLRQVEADTI